ncbi:MAG: 50S ribosomal protein L35 [bacterium]|nr:50S ribosomal protein L35 [bacterium]
MANKAKTNKSILKRMKITKTGKIMYMPGGVNHFQAKKKRSKQLAKKRSQTATLEDTVQLKTYLYHK